MDVPRRSVVAALALAALALVASDAHAAGRRARASQHHIGISDSPTHGSWRGMLRDHQLPEPPWPRRASVRPHPAMQMRPMAPPSAYDPEPSAPSSVDATRFAGALNVLCGTQTRLRRTRYAISHATAERLTAQVLRWSKYFGVDPFLVAGLMYRRSRCHARWHSRGLVGLGRIDVATHELHIRGGFYTYFVLGRHETWRPRRLDVRLFRFSALSLRRPSANVYFTAALLKIARAQARSLERVVKQAAHRHYVSHFVWGDRVRSARDEELILQARRRMLRLYHGNTPAPLSHCRGVALSSPLDGYPRKISSGPRAWRVIHGRRRRHNGVDFVSSYGEPVRAAADGTVMFAGADIRAGAWLLAPARARRVRRRSMDAGGLFVTLAHGHGVRTRYFHLSGYTVQKGEHVVAGQIIGWVGRTGIKHSAPHLHFEIHYYGRRLNPTRYLRPYLVPRHRRRHHHHRRGYAKGPRRHIHG